ncbi:hypothetical protein WJX74_010157 [Apatococcus lobatus]|uniref:Dynein regulatory complex subunit 2 n=1 Tax=Apatococcus lobatus TaxID=904363 RepID=A0AAW1QZ09_9CHLO
MAPKKSGKAKKVETAEEKEERLRLEAIEAAEHGAKLEKATAARLSERRAREQEYAHLNALKIQNQWRSIMRQAKTEVLRKEIEVLSQTHERTINCKDAIIEALNHDLDDAEEQFQTAQRGHIQVMDRLESLHAQRMMEEQQRFRTCLTDMEVEFDAERAEIQATQARGRKEANDIFEAMQRDCEELENEALQEFETAREELRNRASEEYNVLKIQLEGQIEELERTIEAAHQTYLSGSGARMQTFQAAMQRDSDAAADIKSRGRRLTHLQDSLGEWRTKLAADRKEWEDRNRALRAERDRLSASHRGLKATLERQRAQQAERLRQISIDREKDLKEQLSKAERLLKLGELCRKLEREREKVLPFHTLDEAVPTPALPSYQAVQASRKAAGKPPLPSSHSLNDKPMKTEATPRGPAEGSSLAEDDWKLQAYRPDGQHAQPAPSSVGPGTAEDEPLGSFFKRFNMVLLDKASIDRQKAQLQRENKELSQALQQFVDGISVPAAALDDPQNTLLMVKRPLLQPKSPQKSRASDFKSKLPLPPAQILNMPQPVAV